MATAPFVIIPELTAIAIAYRNPSDAYIADIVMPRTRPVATKEFQYAEYDLSAFDRPDTRVGRKGRPNEVGKSDKLLAAAIEDYGLEDPIPQDDIDQGRVMKRDILGEAVEYIMGLITLDRECRVAAVAQNAANYDAANVLALAGAAQFSHADSDPVNTLLAGLDKPMLRPNTVVMSAPVWSKLRVHKKVLAAIYPNGTGGMVSREQFASLLEIKTLAVGAAFVNTARKGQAATLARTWGNNICMLHLDPSASSQKGVTWGMTVPYGAPVGGTIDDPYIGLRGGKRVRAGESLKELVTARGAGFLVQNVLAA
ncbi:MAG: hypothetical protein LBQ51_05495 [Desulfovibrio sp.]|jgi:hypothetical protein|nr:hypothetical protein [Desulfovibrio sp.]